MLTFLYKKNLKKSKSDILVRRVKYEIVHSRMYIIHTSYKTTEGKAQAFTNSVYGTIYTL